MNLKEAEKIVHDHIHETYAHLFTQLDEAYKLLRADYKEHQNALHKEIQLQEKDFSYSNDKVYEKEWDYCATQCIKFPFLDLAFENFLRVNEDKDLYTNYGGVRK